MALSSSNLEFNYKPYSYLSDRQGSPKSEVNHEGEGIKACLEVFRGIKDKVEKCRRHDRNYSPVIYCRD
ncbi:hypothetical protein [Aquiflexum sp.]|uniref:hypothetical protein n=1 Tax=Aquiflexum sp. TaxID=1872584 RepID=UPI003594280F